MVQKTHAKFNLQSIQDRKLLIYIAFICVIGIAGIALRLWWLHHMPTEQRYDFATYQAIAQNIYNGFGHVLEGYPVAWQGSGYSYLLAFFYRIAGNTDELTGKYLNILLSSATMILSYFIFCRVFRKKAYTAAAFILTALSPHLIAYNNVLGTETFFLFLIACILFVQLYLGGRKFTFLLLGALCGAAALTKPYMLVYPFILAVIHWVDARNIKESVIALATMTLVCIVAVAPWTYRNYRLFGRFIPVSYNSGYVLFINNNDTNVTGSWLDLAAVETTADIKAQIEQSLENGNKSIKAAHDIEPLLRSEARDWIKENPAEFLKLGILRLKSTFFSGANDIGQWAMNGFTREYTSGYWTETQYMRNMNALQAFFDMHLSVLSAAGLIFLFAAVKRYALACFAPKGRRMALPANIIFLNIAFFTVVTFVFEGQARYVFPVLLFLIGALVMLVEALNHQPADTGA